MSRHGAGQASAPYRPSVQIFARELRFLFAIDRCFLLEVLRRFLRTLFSWQLRVGGVLGSEPIVLRQDLRASLRPAVVFVTQNGVSFIQLKLLDFA